MNISSIKLLQDWVMIKDEPLEEVTESGLIINVHGTLGEKVRNSDWLDATVVALGPKVTDLKVGDKVLYNYCNGGYDLTIDHKEYFVTKPRNIGIVYS